MISRHDRGNPRRSDENRHSRNLAEEHDHHDERERGIEIIKLIVSPKRKS